MNKVQFLGKEVSKLIVSDNPFNGHSYIVDKTPGSEMRDWYTDSRIPDTLFAIEDSGINTMLPLSDPFMIRLLKKYEQTGGQMFLNRTPEEIRANIKDAYNTIFTALKPNDIAAFGIFQRDRNELAENVEIYEEWYLENHEEENV